MEIKGITHNNLKSLDFKLKIGTISLIKGVSGSGKSSLVKDVLYMESKRQSMLRRHTDDLYYYTVRPEFKSSSDLLEPILVEQAAFVEQISSTISTRTGIGSLLKKIFSKYGQVIYKEQELFKLSLVETIAILTNFYSKQDFKIYYRLYAFEDFEFQSLKIKMNALNISKFVLRDENGNYKLSDINKLKNLKLSNYEVLIDISENNPFSDVTADKLLFIIDNIDYYFSRYYVCRNDGSLWRQPSELLFSTSNRSSFSGYCRSCNGNKKTLKINFDKIIDPTIELSSDFIKIPLTKSGRYQGIKYKPTSVKKMLKENNISLSNCFNNLNNSEKIFIEDLIRDKIESNINDIYIQSLIENENCRDCEGSGLSPDARHVFVNGKSFDELLVFSSTELLSFFEQMSENQKYVDKIVTSLMVMLDLSLGYIAINRSIKTLSSGENQRLKLFELLLMNPIGKIIILDEPSANLHYQDIIKFFPYITLLGENNAVVIVEHNDVFNSLADEIITLGPFAGTLGGEVIENTNERPDFIIKKINDKANTKFEDFELNKKNNINIKKLIIPQNKLTCVVGASGSGKSTLIMDLLFNKIVSSHRQVVKIDNKPIGKNSRSIVATYLGIFDKVRTLYSKNSKELSDSDFSFNSSGMCKECLGYGEVNNIVCSVCLGSRYRAEISLSTYSEVSITKFLNMNIQLLSTIFNLSYLDKISSLFEKLSLSHITLGRNTNSLSGGEVQRVKLAKFIFENEKEISNGGYYMFFDEPCTGLDSKAIDKLYCLLEQFKNKNTLIFIEHNPHLIYLADYIIDLGHSLSEKDESSITCGVIDELTFPSLNHNDVIHRLESKKTHKNDSFNLALELINDNVKKLPSKKFDLVREVYKQQKNFEFINEFKEKYKINISDKNIHFIENKHHLREHLSESKDFFYNPCIQFLQKFNIIPKSFLKHLKLNKSNELLATLNPWKVLVKADNFEEAYVKGLGIIAVEQDGLQYYSNRLFSIEAEVIGQLFPIDFSLYANSCAYCNGYESIQAYHFESIITNSKVSILDRAVSNYDLNKIISKVAIKKLEKEGLFDLSKTISELTEYEFNVLLYGFKNYTFLKPGKKGEVEFDYIVWKGLNHYIYQGLNKIDKKDVLRGDVKFVDCPFCCKGYKNEFDFYKYNGMNLPTYMTNRMKELSIVNSD